MMTEEISFIPIIEAAKKLKNSELFQAGIDQDAEALVDFIFRYSEEQEGKLQKFLNTYDDLLKQIRGLKLENKTQREKCDELWSCLDKALDDQFKNMPILDQRLYMGKAQDAYQATWANLDEKSRIMLATALSIHDAIRNIPEKDLSPVVLELCRVFENEMKLKLYDGFVPLIDPYKSTDAKDPYTWIVQAASKLKQEGDYFLSLSDMIRCVQELKNSRKKCSPSEALMRYLTDNRWNKNKLTDPSFTGDSISYTNNYRNKSAHPNIMHEDDVSNCVRMTKRLVHHFISCMPME